MLWATIRELRLVASALRLSAHVLAEHPEELSGQLVGRLIRRAEQEVVALRERVCAITPHPWLRPLGTSLASAGGALVRTLAGSGRVEALALLPDGRVISGSNDDCALRVWDLATGETTAILEGHSESVTAVAVLSDNRIVSGETTGRLEGHSDSVTAVAVLPDGRVISGSFDHTLRVWDLATGTVVARLTLDAPPTALAVAGQREIVVGSDLWRHSCPLWLEVRATEGAGDEASPEVTGQPHEGEHREERQ
jgi:WD40 repeat protein